MLLSKGPLLYWDSFNLRGPEVTLFHTPVFEILFILMSTC